MRKIIYQLAEIEQVAQQILPLIQSKIILLQGSMGMGKTTLVKALVKALKIDDVVSSPTFSLVNEYRNSTSVIFHFDFYRIKNEQEALDMGIEEYIYSGNWCFIEWSENIASLLPENVTEIIITPIDSYTRSLTIINPVNS
ncbi:tRNA (adenosine(37)-N6)-threonylcarbamoyltransferase complex ATPase subunit type 1 TsaE [Capnocytophaga catalasegens]|uniref:tRNA threonylcarbamoyladenosine biosynthesis protein TsaE n=1 Tax=Capnocytophaga catalasegens TaxID=1004260 RepID=A0AAV5B081_9FLAO|nr:tRNA (adenosine(37)-N6)-threonylcarbamoyltransferase complex ATPase subunit type 1 TsaE [Capnocytophaga catalasegens]GIZ14309.1 tRNA (adenosine(37)-N6)-threonylcarbamoyltransferase complex ATPase subunit type 1 TsaE [Capnocytophaga catalasegens]GJM51306.1 tRNA (adenosine(37)-N6)-threonylcarbamoyltransferase complex ATPase subunit type 1 TsaE [Capnocytophaga catalasegens]GJM53277.1 tRNA (adenosine(37)-N6)-threonylcarbamoyltransferase complex ATPase subunit type 1 TsaE [Capnocytophaga catalaseg